MVTNMKVKLVIDCFREYAPDGVIRGHRVGNMMTYTFKGRTYQFDMTNDIAILITTLNQLTNRKVKTMKRYNSITSATNYEEEIDVAKLEELVNSLRSAVDAIDEMDEDTYDLVKAHGGADLYENMLDTIRDLSSEIRHI